MKSTSATKASIWIACGTLLSRLLGLVRSIALVAAIGATGIASNAFGTASQVTNVVFTLVSTGVLTSVLVPQLTRSRLRPGGGADYINKLITLALFGSLVVCLITALLLPLLMGWLGAEWSAPGQLTLATGFAYWLLPQILFFTLYTVVGEVLNSRSFFGPYAWAPVLNNVVAIVGLATFVGLLGADPDGQRTVGEWPSGGSALLAGSATLGVALQAFVLFLFLRRAGVSYRPDFNFRGTGLGMTAKLGGWTFLSVLVSQVVALALNQAANRAVDNEAGIAAWQLASLVTVLPHSIIVMSLVTSRFTRMSVAAERGDAEALKADLSLVSRLTVIAITLTVSLTVVLSGPIARILMPGASVDRLYPVMLVLVCHVTGAVAFSLLFVLNRAFFAYSDTRTPFIIQAAIAACSLLAIATSLLVPTGTVTAYITLVTNLLFWIQLAATFIALRTRLGGIGGRAIWHTWWQSTIAGSIAAVAGAALLYAFGGIAAHSWVLSGAGASLVSCAAIGTAMALVYACSLFAVRNNEVKQLGSLLRARLFRR